MFTGLITHVGRFAGARPVGDKVLLSVDADFGDEALVLGESIAVSGPCLTVKEIGARGFTAEATAETLARTSLGGKRQGAALNLERALRLGDRLGGHLVSGHIDCTGEIVELTRTPGEIVLRVRAGGQAVGGLIEKGSVAVDGISLTCFDLDDDSFRVALIEHTWEHTALKGQGAGDKVNIELDLIGKYVARLFGPRARTGNGAGVTIEKLAEAGFLDG